MCVESRLYRYQLSVELRKEREREELLTLYFRDQRTGSIVCKANQGLKFNFLLSRAAALATVVLVLKQVVSRWLAPYRMITR